VRARRLCSAVVVAVAAATTVTIAPALAAPASLGGRCLTMGGAGHAVCRSASPPVRTGSVPVRPARTAITFADFAGAYSLYRLISATDAHRGCRLQPTCSLFAAQAARRFGWWRGLLLGLARAQMAHDDQGGFLPAAVASDGELIFLDPVERWIHGAP
jgi:putative component of membrane protein insertase Oxa1/YidC/SpoIIIJ protein YidD